MNKLCYSMFIAFWSSVATLFALQLLAEDEQATAGATHSVEQEQHERSNGDNLR